MVEEKTELRKNFMKPMFEDPMKKREEFAMRTRKKKTHDLISAKRRNLMGPA